MRLLKLSPYSFKVGEIYKMSVASRSHVKSPYYVEITEVGNDYIKTNIPGNHSTKIKIGENWDYHILRMRFVGSDSLSKKLIYNQKNLI